VSRDVFEVQNVVNLLYQAISGPAGPRDWELSASLFVPEGRMVVAHKQNDGSVRLQPLSVDDYRRTRTRYFSANAFYERESFSDVHVVGNLAHVISHYESRRDPAEPPFETGVNFIQLVRASDGWKVLHTVWEAGQVAAQLQT
jgi:hypothetical protein